MSLFSRVVSTVAGGSGGGDDGGDGPTNNVIDIKTALPVSISKIETQDIQTVNARDVHTFLGVESNFTTWLQRRIDEYGFAEGRDFAVCLPVLESKAGSGGHNRTDYALSLAMAKELCMVERNERGKLARQYFIECERRALSKVPEQQLTLPLAHFRHLLETAEKNVAKIGQLEQQVKVATTEIKKVEPKVKTYDAILSSDGWMCVSDAAKQLGLKPSAFTKFLENQKYCFRRMDKFGNKLFLVPSAAMTEKQYMRLIPRKWGQQVSLQTKISHKGLFYLERQLKNLAARMVTDNTETDPNPDNITF